ncbi:hypothetical protein SJA_C1-20570 [Sphingobium indicum UT26S]|uniref:Uncharacterized protein n=1 Tax=Sphingobium indicum (strain DSM 16413 / CCM 7287 / MTCC 6362 / UT26 / NBRC 101211 / UT26S) TaxID=452662 RepID=D4Z2Q9_SPHIU|nr:hypothetical protein SJA_C1-20570 [Sphingobium indicum UT26S]
MNPNPVVPVATGTHLRTCPPGWKKRRWIPDHTGRTHGKGGC